MVHIRILITCQGDFMGTINFPSQKRSITFPNGKVMVPASATIEIARFYVALPRWFHKCAGTTLISHLPSFACPDSRLGPLAAKQSAGLIGDARAFACSNHLSPNYKKIMTPWRRHYFFGTPEMIRTSDARFRKPTLYPLSYGSMTMSFLGGSARNRPSGNEMLPQMRCYPKWDIIALEHIIVHTDTVFQLEILIFFHFKTIEDKYDHAA